MSLKSSLTHFILILLKTLHLDSKIRGHCWMDPSPAVILAQFQILKNALRWDVDAVSKRNMRIREIDRDHPISGHDGEWLGVLGGAWGAFLRYCMFIPVCTCMCIHSNAQHHCMLRFDSRFWILFLVPCILRHCALILQ
jgi:hypothetical protein